ncbi:NACHT domain-containing protein [Vibrio vulnificus]|nr:NACHT domain-containing protein [Vibrio vulnificus]EHZ2845911.1 NACHT domain-containing protein [Vibrio vulnificus]ELK2035878.1 NACHT domain-containing protein [Vibrio vulnificus]ELK2281657.1 NACHT domain-containing protein [Vibrio vulnificus]
MKALIEQLINLDEKLYLEFKMEWYWLDKKPDIKEWGEFLKDFSALVNCSPSHISSDKYLLIGINESESGDKRVVDVDLKRFGFSSIEEFKIKVDEKLAQFFTFEKETPSYYEIIQEEYKGKNILYFHIKPVMSLMVLKKDLQDKSRMEKKGNVFIRELKANNEPQVANASPVEIIELTRRHEENTPSLLSEINIGKSIDKTVKLFLKKNGIFKESGHAKKKIWKEKILFEVYNLKSEFTDDIDFIYLFRDSNQVRTRDYLLENNIISSDSKKYILIDDGLSKDVTGIKSKFSANGVYSLGQFALHYLYKDLLDEDIFHDGEFRKQKQVKNFIEPFTKNSDDKNALVMLNEWFSRSSSPLMVVKGYGGVGKTTLVKYFLDEIYSSNMKKEDGYKILFIDSKKIIDEISLKGNIDNLFNFYDAHASLYNIENKFNKDLLELSLDNGSLLIVVDGIDEVIAKLNSKFDVKKFISSIFENYIIGSAKTKIVLTCRDYFWDANTDEEYAISKIELNPFTEFLAKKLFEKEYASNSKEFKKCVQYANEFKFSPDKTDGEHVFIPYILDVIMDVVKQSRDLGYVSKDDIDSNLLNVELTDDYFIGRICNREIEKLNNTSIDNQISIFMKMAVQYNGYVHDSNINSIFQSIEDSDIEEVVTLFKGHPFISYDHEAKLSSFKYDFFEDFFVNLFICSFLINKTEKEASEDIENLICEHIKYNASFTDRIASRVNFNDELELFIIELIDGYICKIKDADNFKYRKIISSLTCILLSCAYKKNGSSTPEENTNLLDSIFGRSFDYLSIINLFGKESDKLIFDFRGRSMTNVWFENYPFFWECKVNEETSFSNSTFKYLEPRNGVRIPKIHEKLFVKCDLSGIKEILKSSDDNHNKKENSIRSDIIKIFRLFDNGGTFKEQKKEYIEKHANGIILKQLIKKKVISPYKNPKKPKINQLRVSDDFFDIIKVLDQNGSCYELERAVNLVSE